MHRAMTTFATAALMAVVLSACGFDDSTGGDSGQSAASSTTSVSEQPTEAPTTTTTTTTTTKVPGSSGKPSSSSDSSAPSSTSQDTSDEDAGATAITNVWVDDSWSVEEGSEDLCATGGLSHSNYTQQGNDVFTCGPIAASALACTAEAKETTCITNPLGRKAIRFDSDVVEDPGEILSREGDPMPLYVEFEGGAKCATISHDHDQHWGEKHSWCRCSDGSELLTDEDIYNTFDSSADTWTVQRSVGKSAPVETSVATVAYAGK